MSIRPTEIHAAGQRILVTATCEADHRAAIGRFYYSAFHHCQAFHRSLASPGSAGPAKGTHNILCTQLIQPTLASTDPKHTQSKKMGYMLRVLHAQRVKADYTIEADVDDQEAASAGLQSNKILEM